MADARLRQRRPGTRYDRAIMDGWGVRPWNWEFSAGVQHEIMPRLSASFGYFRRIQGNFFVMDNEALRRERLHGVQRDRADQCPRCRQSGQQS